MSRDLIAKLRRDLDRGVLIDRCTWLELLRAAEQMAVEKSVDVGAAGAVPVLGWQISAREDEDQSWLTLVSPDGRSISFSAQRGTIGAQVLQDYSIARSNQWTADGTMKVEDLVAGVKELFPGADRQALQCLGEFMAKPPTTAALTVEEVRAAGGIVHRDGNVFFTNIDMLNRAIGAA